MRKNLLTLIFSMFLVLSGTFMHAQTINAEKAKSIAENFLSQAKVTRGVHAQLEKVWDSNILNGTVTRSIQPDAPTFHAFSSDNSFVIVAGEAAATSIIGYSFEGGLTNEIPAGMADYLACIDSQIKAMRANGKSRAAITDETKLGNDIVNLNTAKWGQREPFNRLCFTNSGAQAATGCVPTAFAIVMRHHKWPKCGSGRIGFSPDGITIQYLTLGHEYDWDNMPLDYSKGYTDEQAAQVATVMRDLGHAYGVSYGTSSTDGYPNSDKISKYFGYVKVTSPTSGNGMTNRGIVGDDEWTRLIKESLDAGCPIPYQANNSGTGSDARHMFVLDGYTDNGYYSFNWGWNGYCNGYFTLSKMDPTSSDEYAGGGISKHNAMFNLKPERSTCTVTVAVNDSNAGTATVNGGTSATVEEGESVTLTATPAEGYEFIRWTVDETEVSCSATATVTVTGDTEYVAHFAMKGTAPEKETYTIKATANEGGTATVNGDSEAIVEEGAVITLSATANDGYTFVNWTVDGVEASTRPVFTTTAQKSVTYTANFKSTAETVIIKLYGSGGYKYINGSTSGKYEANVGSLVTISTESTDNTFAFFTKGNTYKNGGKIVTNKNPYQFIATEDATFYINYIGFGIDASTELNVPITATATAGGKASVNNYQSRTLPLGEEITLRAVADSGYGFTGWSDSSGNIISLDATHTRIVEGAMTYTANFAQVETGISDTREEKKGFIYDLCGRRVEKATRPGIYIVDGKKILIR